MPVVFDFCGGDPFVLFVQCEPCHMSTLKPSPIQ